MPVESGVQQGSVLGPSFFLTYTNDLPAGIKPKVRLFADVTMCSKTIKKVQAQRTLQENLDSLTTWEGQWSMDPQKCSTLSATRERKKMIPAYELHGRIPENVSMTKYLGVTIQALLRWGSHISSTTNKANKTLGFLRHNLKIGNKKTKETAYKALVRPLLEYAATVWDPYAASEIEATEKVQRRAARWVSSRHRQASCVNTMLDALARLANAPRTTQESSAGDVLQVPLWSCLLQLQLPAKTIRQQTELEKKQHLPLRHAILQDTVQTDVVLPQDHTRLERTATGGCNS